VSPDVLQRSPFIPVDIASPRLRYRWDEWNVAAAYQPANPELLERLGGLTHRAQVGLTIATAEWIAWRFEGLSDETMPLEYFEAAWAGNVDLAYVEYLDTDDDEWRGPVLGPLNVALTIVIDGLFMADQSSNTAENPCWAHNLASLVLPRIDEFARWHAEVLDRLERHYRAASEEVLFNQRSYAHDPPIARETFSSDLPLVAGSAPELVDGYLRQLNPEANRFLRSPEELQEMGFEGVPYRFVWSPSSGSDAGARQ